MARYFITGISGFLCRNVVSLLKEEGDVEIVGFAIPGDKAVAYYESDPQVKIVYGDIRDPKAVDAFLEGAGKDDCLIHAAARISVFGRGDPLTMDINYGGTKNLVDAAIAHGIGRFVYVSSVDALSQHRGQTIKEPETYDPEKAAGVYGKSKALSCLYVLEAQKEKGLDAIIVAPTAIMGPFDPYLGPMNDVLCRYAKGKIPVSTPGGYDVADVRDVASGLISAIKNGRSGETYLLTGHRMEVSQLFSTFAEISGVKAPKIKLPFFFLYLIAPFVELFAKLRHKRPLFSPLAIKLLSLNPTYDNEKTRRELGYAPRPMKETILDTYNWLKESGRLG